MLIVKFIRSRMLIRPQCNLFTNLNPEIDPLRYDSKILVPGSIPGVVEIFFRSLLGVGVHL
jgi:hypothetical protein